MKTIYFKQIDALLHNLVPRELAGFEPYRLRRSSRAPCNIERTDRIFRRTVRDGFDLFIVFCPNPRQEELYVDLAWSTKGRFPCDIQRPSVILSPGRTELCQEEAFFGCDQLFTRETGKSHTGWAVWRCSVDINDPNFRRVFVQEDMAPVTDEQAHNRAESAVSQCLADIKVILMPYFDELVQRKLLESGSDNSQ